MKVLCIQGSLNPESNTNVLLRKVFDRLEGVKKSFLDLRDIKLEFFDGRDLAGYHEDIQVAAKEVEESDAFVIGLPVYCYSVSGVLKNFLDIVCGAMEEKPFAIVSASGSERSYLATAELQKILVFEVRARPVPRVVFASGKDFKDGALVNADVEKRLDQLSKEFLAWVKKE